MSQRGEIRQLLQGAADAVERGEPELAAWRVADAGGLLREELAGQEGLEGLDTPTGRGFVLPVEGVPA